jgi:CheY-like chemotaxis protein
MPNENRTTSPPVILVAEDDPAMLMAIVSILEEAGFHVVAAKNGIEALDLFPRSHPHLILSNISMPRMDGIELFRAIRGSREGRRVPFVFLTARGTREDIFSGVAMEADGYLTKPITAIELVTAVQSRLKRFAELKEAFT